MAVLSTVVHYESKPTSERTCAHTDHIRDVTVGKHLPVVGGRYQDLPDLLSAFG